MFVIDYTKRHTRTLHAQEGRTRLTRARVGDTGCVDYLRVVLLVRVSQFWSVQWEASAACRERGEKNSEKDTASRCLPAARCSKRRRPSSVAAIGLLWLRTSSIATITVVWWPAACPCQESRLIWERVVAGCGHIATQEPGGGAEEAVLFPDIASNLRARTLRYNDACSLRSHYVSRLHHPTLSPGN